MVSDIITTHYMVSAIITTHNRLTLLKRAIESVKLQTYRNIELIVVSDGSEDGTKEYCETQKGLKFLHIPPEDSHGANHARNIGALNANGEYIAFLDDDDLWLPQKTEMQLNALVQNPDCDVCCCNHYIINEYSQKYFENVWYKNLSLNSYIEKIDVAKKCLYQYQAITSELMIRKEALLRIGLFDEALTAAQETEMLIRLFQISKLIRIHVSLVVYNESNVNTARRTSCNIQNWKKSINYIYKKHHTLFQKLNKIERIQVSYNQYALTALKYKNSNQRLMQQYYILRMKFCRLQTKIAENLGYKLS